LRTKTKKFSGRGRPLPQWGAPPHTTPSVPWVPQFDPQEKFDKSSTVPPREIPGYAYEHNGDSYGENQ